MLILANLIVEASEAMLIASLSERDLHASLIQTHLVSFTAKHAERLKSVEQVGKLKVKVLQNPLNRHSANP